MRRQSTSSTKVYIDINTKLNNVGLSTYEIKNKVSNCLQEIDYEKTEDLVNFISA